MNAEPADPDLDRLRDLCADLASAGNGQLLAWGGPGEAARINWKILGSLGLPAKAG